MLGILRTRQHECGRRVQLVEPERIDLRVLLVLAQQLLGGLHVGGGGTAQAAGDFAALHAQRACREILTLLQ
jgi:hypothetical protein